MAWCCGVTWLGAVVSHGLVLWCHMAWCCGVTWLGAVVSHGLVLWCHMAWCCGVTWLGVVVSHGLVLWCHMGVESSNDMVLYFRYCLSTDDLAMDARLQRLQQRCLASERASHCFNSNTPLQERRCRPRTLDDDIIMDGQAVASTGAAASGHDGTKDVATSNLGGVAASSDCDQSREGPGAVLRTHLGTKMRGRAPPAKRGTKRKLNLKLQPPPFDMGAGSSGDGLVTESDVPGRGAQASVAPGTLPRKPSVRTTKSSEVVPRPNAVSADLCAQHEEGPRTEDGSMCTVLPTITEGADTGIKRTEKEDNRESRKKVWS